MPAIFSHIFVALFTLVPTWAQERTVLYDPPVGRDTDPVSYYLNGSLDVTQNPYWFTQERFFDKHRRLWRRVRSPDKSIRRDGGYRKLWEDEFAGKRALPNLTLHLLGGTYDTRMLYEYYRSKNAPAPYVLAVANTYLAHLGNEALELSSDEITSHDHIADLFFFDSAGAVLALSPKFSLFLRDGLGMSAWHLQPLYLPEEEDFTNAGLNYLFRPSLFGSSKIRPAIYLGMLSLAGASAQVREGHELMVLAGMSFTNPVQKKGRLTTALMYEGEGHQSAQLLLNGTEDYRWRLNLFPHLLRVGNTAFGGLVGQKRSRDYLLGVTLRVPLGLGVAL